MERTQKPTTGQHAESSETLGHSALNGMSLPKSSPQGTVRYVKEEKDCERAWVDDDKETSSRHNGISNFFFLLCVTT